MNWEPRGRGKLDIDREADIRANLILAAISQLTKSATNRFNRHHRIILDYKVLTSKRWIWLRKETLVGGTVTSVTRRR